MYLTEWENFDVFRDQTSLVWNEDMIYGDSNGGSNGDGSFISSTNVTVPEVSLLPLNVYTIDLRMAVVIPFLVHSPYSRMEPGTCTSSWLRRGSHWTTAMRTTGPRPSPTSQAVRSLSLSSPVAY